MYTHVLVYICIHAQRTKKYFECQGVRMSVCMQLCATHVVNLQHWILILSPVDQLVSPGSGLLLHHRYMHVSILYDLYLCLYLFVCIHTHPSGIFTERENRYLHRNREHVNVETISKQKCKNNASTRREEEFAPLRRHASSQSWAAQPVAASPNAATSTFPIFPLLSCV